MDRVNRYIAISHQEEIILRKKKEIEEKRKEFLKNNIAKLGTCSTVKEEPNGATSRVPLPASSTRSLAAGSRHKALLRSGMVGKAKPSIAASKVNSSALKDCFDSADITTNSPKPKKEEINDYSEPSSLSTSSGSCKSSVTSSNSSTTAVGSQSSSASGSEGGEESAAWFQEALQRARLKAQQAGVCPAASSLPPSKRSRWEHSAPSSSGAARPAFGMMPLMPATAPAPTPVKAMGVLSLSVPKAVMGMVGDGEHLDAIKGVMLTRLTRYSPVIVAYAKQVFGNTDGLSDSQWRQCQDQIKMNVVFQLLQAKQVAADRLAEQGKVKYEYDSDEETDGGTWEHKRRKQEMDVTARKAEELTEKGAGKHHIGDFLPPDELQKFMEKFCAIREGRDPDFSDYRNNKLTDDNIGYRMLKSMGWTEGQGLGPEGQGITQPVNQNGRSNNHGLGVSGPDCLTDEDNEYDAYRKRMMLSYRFRPNPLNNPRRQYY